MNKLIDMHTHTNYSDGEYSPKELIEKAKVAGINTLAITDHDTLEGLKNIPKNIKGIKVIPGIELTAKVPKGRMHILGYNIDINNKELNDQMSFLKTKSINSVISLIEQLKKDYKIYFTYEEIKELVNYNHNLGRPDLARLLIRKGYVKTVQEAFDKYLIKAYDKTRKVNKNLTYKECIQLITNSGGIPVLAHPHSLELDNEKLEKLIRKMIKLGLRGIEVYHSKNTKEEEKFYLELADKYNLLISGGTDYHGPNTKPDIFLGIGKNNIHIEKLSILDEIKKTKN